MLSAIRALHRSSEILTRASLATAAVLVASLAAWPGENPAGPAETASNIQTRVPSFRKSAPRPALIPTHAKLPLAFEANNGQTDQRVQFLTRGQGYTLFLTGDEAVLSLSSRQSTIDGKSKAGIGNSNLGTRILNPETRTPDVLRMKLAGARVVRAEGVDPLPTRSNYFLGNDPKKWRRNVPNFGKVKYANVYPGIDLIYYGNQRQLEYDFVVAPGADPKAIRFEIVGEGSALPRAAEGRPYIDASGDLVIASEAGEVRFRKPVVYQEDLGFSPSADGQDSGKRNLESSKRQSSIANRKFIDGRYVLQTSNPKSKIENAKFEVSFELAAYNPKLPLIIDPVLGFSTYLGGTGNDSGLAIAVDSVGSAYVVGTTDSTDFPGVAGTFGGLQDAFVVKIDATGSSLLYATYLGGSSVDQGLGIAVDASGNAYVTGLTSSAADFPTQSAFQATIGGGGDAFVTKIDPSGSALIYSTFLGGSGNESGVAIAFDANGSAFVLGNTSSPSNFPTMNAYQASCTLTNLGTCSGDLFLSKLNPAGSALQYSTYLGGSGQDFAHGLALDPSVNAYITGETKSTDFPTFPGTAFDTTCGSDGACNGLLDGFVSKFNLNAIGAPSLVYSTYLGDSGNDQAFGVDVDSLGNAYVTGATASANFPTLNPYQSTRISAQDGFLTKLNPSGESLVYSTFLGAQGLTYPKAIAVDASGSAYVAGFTLAGDFPTVGAYQDCSVVGEDVFITKFAPAGTTLEFSTCLGGTGADLAASLAIDTVGNAYVTGNTTSTDFPNDGLIQVNFGGGFQDAFVAKFGTGYLNPTPYLCQSDSPFFADIQAGNMYLETLEDSTFNTPGVAASAGGVSTFLHDSVDCDDGVIDGSGSNGRSFFSPSGPAGITFTFNATTLGGFPTKAGIAWTDGGGGSSVTFEAFDNVGASLGVVGPVAIADGSNGGTTAEDRFFGAVNPNGISAIHISNSSGGIEVDHLQYGLFTGASPLTISPGSADFGSVNVGNTSSGSNIVITNTSTFPAGIAYIIANGDFAIKVADTDCPIIGEAPLGAGLSCNLDLEFSPTAAGPRQGFAQIGSNVSGSPHVIPLTGIGVGASVEPVAFIHQPLVPASVAPGSVSATSTFPLTVHGTGFSANSIVHWNGNAQTTAFNINFPNQLVAAISGADVATASTAEVAVDNPAPGGSGSVRSNIVFFHVTTPTASVLMSGTDYAAGDAPTSVTTGDFNEDGALDLAVANANDSTVAILLGNGAGTFVPTVPPTFSAGFQPLSVTTGDFNGDGKLDLAAASGLGASILLGIGDGTFQPLATYGAGAGSRYVTTADFNADGWLDLAVANQSSDTVSILLGNGDGFFQLQTPYAAGVQPYSVTAGDFNGDDKLDLAVANGANANTVSILLGNGDGTFLPTVPPTFATGGLGARSVTAADFDGDAILDLAVTNVVSNQVSILLGNGDGSFLPQALSPFPTGITPSSMAVGDFNGDDKLDLAVGNAVSFGVVVRLGNGEGTFQASPVYATGTLSISVTTGDFNQDGRLDLAVANFSSDTVSVLLQTVVGPGVQLSTNSLTFADSVLNPPSPELQQVTLTNNGTAALDFACPGCGFNVQISTSDSTASPDFSSNNTCGTALAALASCTINAFFNPTALGPLTAVIAINSDAATSPDFISLSGTGVSAGVVTPSVTLLDFSSVQVGTTLTQLLTLTNTGGSMNILGLALTGSFTLDAGSTTCPNPGPLAATTSCDIGITFAPTVVGAASGQLAITHDAAGSPTLVVLTGAGFNVGFTGIVPPFDADYTAFDLGSVPGVPPLLGGLTFKFDDPHTILIGGDANDSPGKLYAIRVIRDAQNHITGFDGSATAFADAAFNDGGVVYGPNNVLFLARWPVNELGQTKPGSILTDKIIDLTPLGVASSVAGLNFAPQDFSGEGQLKLVSWPLGEWYTAAFSPDVTGTFDVTSATQETTIPGGPEGFIYVPAGSPQFTDFTSILVSEFTDGSVSTYQLDGNGDPIPATRATFFSGLDGALGAAIDPLTGDFLFSTFGGGDRVQVVRGFAPPAPIVISPTSVNFPGNPINLTCPTKAVTITNTGDVDLVITDISIDNSPPFTQTNTCSSPVAPGGSCVVSVRFAGLVVGPAAATMTIMSNAAGSPHTVALSGNGTPSCQLLARVRSVTVLRGTDVQDFAIEDAKPSCSPVELNLTCSVDNPAACLLNPAVIAPSGASTLKVSNLKRVGSDALQVTVTSTSEFRTATERVTVHFADFAFTKSPDAATVAAGGAASYSLAVRPINGLAGNVAFTCAGAPRGATCAVEPSSITLDGASLAQVKVKVSTAGRAGALPVINLPNDWSRRITPLLAMLLGLMMVFILQKSRRVKEQLCATRLAFAVVLLAMLVWASCGGGGSMGVGASGTPAGSYTLTITGTYSSATGATPGTLANSTTVTLRVN